MAHPQIHRGPAPMDERLFGAAQTPTLRAAVSDLCWLLDHGYASHSATELVGNRHNLSSRQRMAISRCACSVAAAQQRQQGNSPRKQSGAGNCGWMATMC